MKTLSDNIGITDMKTLSDKILKENYGSMDMFMVEDVKEFIKELREKIIAKEGVTDYVTQGNVIIDLIDELAGKDLI